MNPTPCPECNFIAWRISCAYTRRDYADLRYWQNNRLEHQETCIVVNGDWYKLLWPSASLVPAGGRPE